MKKPNILFIAALCAFITIINADISEKNGELTAVVEETVKKVHSLQPGEKEYLSPNLIGVQNIAITNIPVTMNFINIIDAFREVVDGVRYEILLNAVNTTDNNTEIVCRIVVLEKPWLTTIWGDKVRLLQDSNCTSEELLDNARNRKALEDKYETNAIFTGSRNELTPDDMVNLESQIIGSSNNPQMTRTRHANPLPSTIAPIVSTDESVDSSERATNAPVALLQTNSAAGNNEEQQSVVVPSTESTTTENIPELNENEKKWLDDFLSIGSYNFEASLANKNPQSETPESEKRSRREIVPGGVKQLDADEIKKHQETMSKSLAKLDSGDAPNLIIDTCHSGSSQVVAGMLIKLDCDMVQKDGGDEKDRCLLSMWMRPWLGENGLEITFECKNSPKSVHRPQKATVSEKHNSISQRKTRDLLLGGPQKLDEKSLKEEQENLSKSLAKLATGESSWVVENCESGTTQVVSGSLTKLNCALVNEKTGKKDICTISLWSQPWLKENKYELTMDCKDTPKSVQRFSRSVDNGHHKQGNRAGGIKQLTDFELKEQEGRIAQSLAKVASGDGPSYSILRSFNGTKQTVAGSLVKIFAELTDENTGAKVNCTISLWSRPWIPIDGYEVSYECKDKPKSVHRHSRSVEYAEKKTMKKSHRSLDKVEHLFQKFQTKYQKEYHNGMERQMRLRIFKHNLKLIHDLNKNEMGSAKYGITEFADMTTTEYRDRTGLLSREESSNLVRTPAKIPDVELPKEFDWREKGAISEVKNQGNCGSCWAFSVTGNIEGLHAVKTGKLEEYSEQELLDCDTIDSACNGGLPDDAYKAIENIGGLELESQYPYKAKKSSCQFNSTLSRVKIAGAVDLPKNETEMAKWLIVNGPISIGINANAMQFYRGGVSHPWKMLCSKKNLDHGVLIVGFGVSEYPTFKKTLPYWIVKNSWGSKWGEQGYYRVYRGDNTCGLSEMATSAVLAS